MEVNSEENETSKSQPKKNETGIPFPLRLSRADGEARLYSIPTVRGMPLSRLWLLIPGRGLRVHANQTNILLVKRSAYAS